MLFTYPLMCAMQMIGARIGRTTGHGIAGNLRRHYPTWLLQQHRRPAARRQHDQHRRRPRRHGATRSRLLIGGPAHAVRACCFGALRSCCRSSCRTRAMSRVLKWLTLVLFAYFAALFMVHGRLGRGAARSAACRKLRWDTDYLTTVVAVLGTTISPYLFFWQAAQEVEDMHASAPAPAASTRAPNRARTPCSASSSTRWSAWGSPISSRWPS